MNTPQKKTNDGWIKLFRQFLDWEWHDVPETAYLFVILLLLVNHQDQKWHGQIIRRGQVLTSRDKLMAITGLSARKIRTSLERLQRTSEICIETTNQNTLITITNYDRYQGCGEGGRPATDQHATSISPANDRQSTLNKKDNNETNSSITIQLDAPAREVSVESWRFISSVRRNVLHNNPDVIAAYKTELFRREAEALSLAVGMSGSQVEKFVRYWTEHSPGCEKIRADSQEVFDMKIRLKNWMEHDASKVAQRQAAPKSRMDAFMDDIYNIHTYYDGERQANPAPDEQ